MKDPLSLISGTPERLDAVWVAAVALIDRHGQVLMQQRPRGSVHGGLWEFPGGKLEPGEGPEIAAARELLEELELEIDPADMVPVCFAAGSTAGRAPPRPLTLLLFACSRWQGVPAPHAASALEWYDVSTVADLAMPPLDYPLARALAAFLASIPR